MPSFSLWSLGVDNRDEPGRVEQKGGVGSGASTETSAEVHTSVCSVHQYWKVRNGSNAQDSGVLLREYELHEDLPENHPALLQK